MVRFYDYRQITAKFASKSTSCGKEAGGHDIKPGDVIGYAHKHGSKYTHCAECWAKWVSENQEADRLESSGNY